MHHILLQDVEDLQDFPVPSKSSPIANGQYSLKTTDEVEVESETDEIKIETWFKSPPLDIPTIKKIRSLQLFAETHDQGWANEASAGNWTWLELAIIESELSTIPRRKDGIELIWTSHRNRFLKEDYGWGEGDVFENNHDILRLLEKGNVIAVRLCARFPGWIIAARKGYLVFDIAEEMIIRKPVEYKTIVSDINEIQNVFNTINKDGPFKTKPSLPTDVFSGDGFSTGGERPLRVLSLDGGGVRGLASLLILKEVMEKTAPEKKPCEVFDMIAGTSTGGLIAIMLGRLEMNVQDCIDKYKGFMEKIFDLWDITKAKNYAKTGAQYVAETLEKVIKDLIREKLGDDDVDLFDAKNSPCKVFVTAVKEDASNNREPVFLRSYQNPNNPSEIPGIKLWQAARATSAAPGFFPNMQVGNQKLVDGGLGANNPTGWLWTEVLSLFGPARRTDCFLSIGTGIPKNESVYVSLVNAKAAMNSFASIATNSEITHILFSTLINAYSPEALGKKYYRLNIGEKINEWDEIVTTGIWPFRQKSIKHHLQDYKDIGELDAFKERKKLEDMTKSYIDGQGDLILEVKNALCRNLK